MASARDENWALIRTPTGEIWSGRTRYAAATWFYKHGLMDADVLEVYRVLARLDNEDPSTMLMQTAQGRAWLVRLSNAAEPAGNP